LIIVQPIKEKMSDLTLTTPSATKQTTGSVKKKKSQPLGSIDFSNLPIDFEVASEVKVLKSIDYDGFYIFQGNRSINRAKVERLKEAMGYNHLITPIDVNEKLEVIDGQHRFTASKELGLPIWFILREGWSLREMHTLNQLQTTFRAIDYLPGYVKMGVESYIVFGEFMEQYNFNFMVTMALLSNTITAPRGSGYENFKSGTFKIADLELAHDKAKKILDYSEFYEGFRRDKFCFALLRLFKRDDYNHQEMMDKLRVAGQRLFHQPLVNDYLIILQREFNKGRMEKNKVNWAKFE
jgi:hypothetical protein